MKKNLFLLCLVILILDPHRAFSKQWETVDKQFEIFLADKRFNQALSAAQESIDIAQTQHKADSGEYSKSLQNMAISYMMLGQWENGLRYYKELLRREIRRLAEINVSMSTTIESITGLYELLHDKKSAAAVYQKATQRLSQLKTVDNRIYTDLSDYYTQALMNQPAPTISQSLDMIAKQTGVDVSSIRQTVNQHGLNSAAGETQPPHSPAGKAEVSIQDLIEQCAENKRYSNFSGGIASCTKLYELQRRLGQDNSIEHGQTCFDLGYFYLLSSRYTDSVDYYQEGIDIWDSNNYPRTDQYIEALYNASTSLKASQKYNRAKILLIKAESAAAKFQDDENSLYPGILALLAAMQRMDGDYSGAEESYNRYRDYYLSRKNSDPAVWLNYYLGAGLVYEQLGKWQEADKVYQRYNQATIDLIREMFQYLTVSSEKKVARSFVGFRYNQDFFYSYCQKRKTDNPQLLAQMYNSELLTKSLALRTMRKKADQIYNSGDLEVIGYFEQWIDVRQKMAKLSLLSISDRKINLDELEVKIKQLENKMMTWLLSNQPDEKLSLNWQDVQKELLEDDAAIEFIKFQDFDLSARKWRKKVFYAALVIRQGYDHPRFINLFEEAEFQSFLNETSDPAPFEQVRKMYTWLPGQYGGIYKGDTLYKLVWKKLEPYLKGVKHIYYSPAGLLHKISFDAVPVSEKQTLIGMYSLQRLSTTGLLADSRSDFYLTKDDNALLFGGIRYDLNPGGQKNGADHQEMQETGSSELFIRDRSFDWTRSESPGGSWPYLGGSLAEVEGIGAILKAKERKHKTLAGEKALEERFKEPDENHPEIIHIATHGFFLPTKRVKKTERQVGLQADDQLDPDETFKRSGLLFAGANTAWHGKPLPEGFEDGILTSYEISKLNLTETKLVVMSACETGLGDIGGAEGVYGLQRAFKLAGVDNIIMSLWQIPDAQTAELMEVFYSQWLAGKELKEAFHIARQRMSEKYEPYYWGAFVLLH